MSIISKELKSRKSKEPEEYKSIRGEAKKSLGDKRFKAEYIKTNFNGVQAIKNINPNISDSGANKQAIEAVKRTRDDILALFPSLDSSAEVLSQALDSPTPDTISWKDKLSANRDVLNVRGMLSDKHQATQTNIALVVQK